MYLWLCVNRLVKKEGVDVVRSGLGKNSTLNRTQKNPPLQKNPERGKYFN